MSSNAILQPNQYATRVTGNRTAEIIKSSRIGAVAAFGFALLLFLTVAVSDVPHDATDTEMITWWSKSSNQNAALVSSVLCLAAASSLLIFLTQLRQRLRSAGSIESATIQFTFSAGVVGVGLLIVSRFGIGVIARAVKMDDQPLPGSDLLRYLPQFGYLAMTSALCILGIAILSAALANRTDPAFGQWWTVTSAGLGLILLIGSAAVGPFIIPVLLLWTIVTGIGLWRPVSRAD